MDIRDRRWAVIQKAYADGWGAAGERIIEELDKLDAEISEAEGRLEDLAEEIGDVSDECEHACESGTCSPHASCIGDEGCSCSCPDGSCAQDVEKKRRRLTAERGEEEAKVYLRTGLREELAGFDSDDPIPCRYAIVAPGHLFEPPGCHPAADAVTAPVTDAVLAESDVARMRAILDDSDLVKALRAQVESLTGQLENYRLQYGPFAPERLCACGCGKPVTSPRPEARYATGACRVRALRRRQEDA